MCARLSVGTGECVELDFLVAELCLIMLHIFVFLISMKDHTADFLSYAKILLLNTVKDLLLLC